MSISIRNEQEQMHCHHSEIRTNKLLAKCCNSFVMDLIQTFPFLFFLMNLEKHFPSFAAFDDLSVLVLSSGVLIIVKNSEIGDPGSCLIREAVC